ncbi:MAG: monovalent cation/H+ antiporter complex subunit F [Oscillospiraceae bacterium]|nr:monovalent cation/H+ antiporter complex subunit F [Oscillospiraceae bacterium]MCL2279698.1 monovalent cation/H+ antiporter complex subunit F [Oscillospiraceae bacterium]
MYVLWVLLFLMILYMIRGVKGPTIWDRLLALNLIATKIIVIIVIFASLQDEAFLLDFALLYSLSSFIGTIFIALFLSKQRLGKRRGKR